MTSYGVTPERDWNALSDEEFRAVVRREFEEHYPSELRYPPRRLYWDEQQAWYQRMAAKGWIAPNWPVEYGGMGLAPAKLLIFFEEQERWGVARFQDHGTRMVGPVLIRHGTEEQRRRLLPPILTCEHRYSQGYSEPEAGSDLVSLRTKAWRDGDEFVIEGQKTWSTMAHDATHLFLLARTDPEAKAQEGISFFLLDLSTPGVTLRPIRDIAGHTELSEVFFDGVRIPADNLVGDVNRGWTIAKSILGFERLSIGSPQLPEYGLQMALSLARARGLLDDPVVASKLAEVQLDVAHLADAYSHFAGILVRGEELGPDVSLLKVWASETFQRIADLIIEMAGPAGGGAGTLEFPGGSADILAAYYKARPTTIYGGTNEIQRNILAKQVLNLPTAP